MANDSAKPERPKSNYWFQGLVGVAKSTWSLMKSKAFWRFVIISSTISFLTLMFLGFAFHFIVFGALIAIMRISVVYLPAERFVAKVAGLSADESLLPQVTGPLWKKLLVTWPAILYTGISVFGMWLLVRDGFLSQNLIYLLFFK